MLRKLLSCSLFAFLLLPTIAARADDLPKPLEIITLALHTYDHHATVQFKTKSVSPKGPDGIRTSMMEAKAEITKTDFKTQRLLLVTRDSVVKDGVSTPDVEVRMVDDGKTIYVINPQEKTYQSGKHTPDICSNYFGMIIQKSLDVGFEYFVIRAKSQGKLVYIVSSKNAIKGIRSRIIIGIEDAGFVILRMSTLRDKSGEVINDMTVSDQVFDAPLPDELFAKPPDDYRSAETSDVPLPASKNGN